ncbi:flavonol sulfotransferase-like [Coffea arabica]|uniref:Sulfotransferase n=1 Tax=Coffea arabica TaxID=13443 RepID=A0A6P6VK44_COFAR|nr:flavonol sulfotransferase-like [Coffea arabica]XP_027102312.1 flavonol sulfotransferase-like [Coffea arabica]
METNMRYPEIISALPKREGIDPSLDFYEYQGFWFPLVYLEATITLQEHFKANPEDIFLCSFVKTGTTWLKALAFSILTRDRFMQSPNPLLNTVPHECFPHMEVDLGDDPSYRTPQLPLLATHIPYTSLPKSILESGCKIIYICREPKDTFTSYWHMLQTLKHLSTGPDAREPAPSLEEELELFCQGKSAFGPYWDHVLGFWRASIERPETMLFLKYEELKKDELFYVKKLAEFMGKPFSQEEEIEGVPEKIIGMCSFRNLSNLEVNKSGFYQKGRVYNNSFFRKGDVGDWKNLLTEDMKVMIDYTTEQKLQFSGFTFGSSSEQETEGKSMVQGLGRDRD